MFVTGIRACIFMEGSKRVQFGVSEDLVEPRGLLRHCKSKKASKH